MSNVSDPTVSPAALDVKEIHEVSETAATPGVAESGRPSPATSFRLVFLSFLMLFLELALIRWTAANNVHLAYVTNLVLIGSFLGIGVGFLLAHASLRVLGWTPVALAVLTAFVLTFPVKLTALVDNHFEGASGMSALPRWLSLSVIFVLVVIVMAGVGQALAETFSKFRPLDAYRLDVLGSVAGIAVFSLLSFLWLPPISWGAIVVLGMFVMLGRQVRWWQGLAALSIVILLALESMSAVDQWSPYYKITATEPSGPEGGLVVSANNIPHQTAYSVATLRRIESFYFFPYRHLATKPRNVLVIGAGTGNDVAVALSEGAGHVDAVEVDPVIAQLGREKSPSHPYQNPRVTLHVDDGRAYLENTDRHYDLILFALPDSLTVLAGQSSLRLENYLLTIDALRAVKAHLNPKGTFSMYNYYQPALLDRYASSLRTVYGSSPCVQLGDPLAGRRQAVLTIGAHGGVSNCRTVWSGKEISAATDNHPFPYLFGSGIPAFYVWTVLLILAFSLVVIRTAAGSLRTMTRYLDLACMGAAFMLLETKNIVQFALLFGTTWFVNSLVFAGILVSVYAAIETARHLRLPRPFILYVALLVALGVAWIVPQEDLLSLSSVPRFLAAITLAFAPVFLANLVFAQRFKDVGSSTKAFGANLLGTVVGALLEYLSLVTGYQFLLVVVALLYGLAFLLNRRRVGSYEPRRLVHA